MQRLRPALLALTGLALAATAEAGPRPVVYTVNYPLQYFASRIAGDLVQVEFPAPAGIDPAFWTPDEATLLRYQQADLILLNGAGYAHWLDTVSMPVNRLVDTTRELADQYIYSGEVTTHAHGPAGEHSHERLAATTWLDMNMAVGQARSVARALAELIPDQKQILTRNLSQLVGDLERLDSDLRNIGAVFGDRPLLASHPVYQYFSRRYTFNLQSVHWEPGEVQPVSEWQQLGVRLEKFPARWMIWEMPPLPETADALERLGIAPVVYYTISNRPAQGDFISVMRDNITSLKRIIENP